tara:strand:+ start:88 stop:333 length:246 start_codon:yes stop_codon:yes gene_type:complete
MGGLYGSKWRKSLLEPITQSEVLMRSKFHAVSLNSKSYKELKEIQKLIPVRLSVPQTIEWLIKVGQKQIKSEIKNTNVNEL